MNWILFYNKKLFIIFLFYSIIHIVNSTSFDYPYYITLSNDNIFFIHYEGIDIYDSSFNKINQIYQFSGNEEMTEEIFGKIELKHDNEFILSIINDKIYIFNNEGKFLFRSKDKINNNQTIINYALTSIGLYNDTYKYIIGYFDDDKFLNLLLYRYNITENNNTLINIKKNDNYYYWPDYKKFERGSKVLSCEYMSSKFQTFSNEYRDLLTCFFFSGHQIGAIHYYIFNNTISSTGITAEFTRYNVYSTDYGQTYIKSELNYDRRLAFVWFHLSSNHKTYFTTFNTSNNTFEYLSSFNCSSEIYKTKTNNIPKNKEIDFTCEIKDKEIKTNLYRSINSVEYKKSYFSLNVSCENYKGPSISYYNNKQNYYIYYCFKNCSDEFYKNDSYCLNLERKQTIKKIVIYIIITIIIIILLAISIFLLIRYLRKTKEGKLEEKTEERKKSKKDEEAMNDILTELLPSNN